MISHSAWLVVRGSYRDADSSILVLRALVFFFWRSLVEGWTRLQPSSAPVNEERSWIFICQSRRRMDSKLKRDLQQKTTLNVLYVRMTVHCNILKWMKSTDALSSNFIGMTTLHVSGSLSAHYQKFWAVHRFRTPDDGQKGCPKHVESSYQ